MQSKNRWQLSVGNEPSFDFLIQLLLDDGLRVDPFVAHPAHRGDLHRRGLTAAEWLEWLRRIAYARLLAHPQAEIHPMPEWPGSSALAETLVDLWERYRANYSEILRSRRRPIEALFGPERKKDLEFNTNDALAARQSHGLPTLQVFQVRYPVLLVHMATRDIALLGDAFGQLGPAELARSIADAAEKQRVMHGRSGES